MDEAALLLDIVLSIAVAGVYLLVGVVTGRRRVDGDGQLAVSLFALWWHMLAAMGVIAAMGKVLAVLGIMDASVHATVAQLTLLTLCLALASLLYYLVYLYTGKRRMIWPVGGFYAAYYAWLVYLVESGRPTGAHVEGGRVVLDYAREFTSLEIGLVLLLLLVPPLLGALGYARLFFRAQEATQRYRIGLVSGTIAAWFTSSLLAWGFGFDHAAWWPMASRAIGLAAALLVFAAYRPPAFARRRWGIRPIDEPTT